MIDASLVPEESIMDLVDSFHRSAMRAFRNPEYQRAYEQWAEERREKENGRDKGVSDG